MAHTHTLFDLETDREASWTAAPGSDRIPPEALREGLGWELKPEGLCRGSVCIPVRDRTALVDDTGIELAALANALGRPMAHDAAENTAVLGIDAAERATALATLDAPDFTLPDLSGRLHSLSEHRGKKVLLIAYASW